MTDLQRLTHHVVRPMGTVARLTHWTLIVFTLGLWYPIYRAARKARGELA